MGKKAVKNYSYYDLVWRDDPYTYSEYESNVNPHQNNGHTVFSGSFYDGHFLMAGAETATDFPGYMDGAAESAKRVAKKNHKSVFLILISNKQGIYLSNKTFY